MTNPVLYRKTVTETLTFVDKPTEETRKQLQASGFLFDSKSRQWFRSTTDSGVQEESEVTAPQAA